MTQTLASPAADSVGLEPMPAPFIPTQRDWKYCGILLGVLLCLYLLIQNGYWASGPDTAYYIAVARDVALGRGLTFNGDPVGRAPPGWPLVLAAAMKISPTFRFINLVPMACILASIGMWYFVLRRLTTTHKAFWIALLSGTLFQWYQATNQLRTEGLFCLVFTAALLVASQIAEGRAHWWRIALLLLLCIGIVSTRYAGLAASFVVGAVVLSGQRRPRKTQWIAFVGSIAITIASFIAIRYALRHVIPEINVAETPSPGPGGEETERVAMTAVFGQAKPLTYLMQGLKAGQWVSALLWMPMHIAVSNKWLGLAVNLLGWFLLAIYTVCLIRHVRQHRWILIGVAAYCASVIFRWPVVNPRYLMPIAPFLLLGIWLGMEQLRLTLRKPWASKLFAAGVPILVVSLLLCNLTLFAIDAIIARSSNFYHYYFAGEVEELIGAARYLQGIGVENDEVAVNAQYVNLNRTRSNGFGMRGLVMLLDRRIAVIPNKSRDATKSAPPTTHPKQNGNPSKKKKNAELLAKIGDGPPNKYLLLYAAEQQPEIRYYVYRPPISPWRAWHFRVPALQRWVTGQQDIPDNPGWELYQFKDNQFTRIPIPDARDWLVRVPGM
jgi:hypothetical protein